MKTRNSLVSNSSTSSFVIFGYKISYDRKDRTELVSIVQKFNPSFKDENMAYSELYDIINTFKDFDMILDGEGSKLYVGYIIANHIEDDGIDNQELLLSDLMKKCDAAKQKFGFKDEPKIFASSKVC